MFIHKKITLELEPFALQALTDEKWFQVLLEQILSNAVKYTRQGSVRIYVQQGHMLTISDNGAGIPKEDLPRVFDRAIQAITVVPTRGLQASGCTWPGKWQKSLAIACQFIPRLAKERKYPLTFLKTLIKIFKSISTKKMPNLSKM